GGQEEQSAQTVPTPPVPAPTPAPTAPETPPPAAPATPKASDWCTAGWDCVLFCGADLDGDRRAEVLTINGGRQLCAAFSVQGWKASPWVVLLEPVAPDPVGLGAADILPAEPGTEILVAHAGEVAVYGRFGADKVTELSRFPAAEGVKFRAVFSAGPAPYVLDEAGGIWTVSPNGLVRVDPAPALTPLGNVDGPPYEIEAGALTAFTADVNADDVADVFTVYSATRPHQHRCVRLAITPRGDSGDLDADGLSDADEATQKSDPLDRDSDDDGLLDGWEVHGLPRGIQGDGVALSPVRQDVIVSVSRYEQIEEAALRPQLERSVKLYAGLHNRNPDGSTGLALHCRVEAPVPADKQHGGSWWSVGMEQLPANQRGVVHWMQVTPGGGGQAQQTGDMGGSGNNWAAFVHEFGHQLSLSHEGDSEPAWCPLYPSLMNYAFHYSIGGDPEAVRFSDGSFRETVLDERALSERLPYSYEKLKYLEAGPFRYTLQDDGAGGTLIDWNHSGTFDPQPVAADVNYGSSTNGGARRKHEQVGSAPALAYVGGVCHLAAMDQWNDHVFLKSYQGEEKWGEPRVVPASASRFDPVLVGGAEGGAAGWVFWKQADGWHGSRFTNDTTDAPMYLPELGKGDLAAGVVSGRLLLVTRHEDDVLAARWFEPGTPLSPPQRMETRSQVAPAIAQAAADGRIVLVSSMPNSRGGQMCMRVTDLTVHGDRVIEGATAWTRGEASGNNCTTRPVAGFTEAGQLVIFHTGWQGPDGRTTAWRTLQVANKRLDEGWLTCMMYDIWTTTRVGVGFASGPQGAIYAFRWDSGPHHDWGYNQLLVAHNGLGIESAPMRDFDDGAKISQWGIRHSILNMLRE
ncbi:MAG: hypothetical protein H7Y88_05110, partial [Phycisphaerales bacterium]|nr:hypothetical protein [Phycisphaerales bacterium]